MNTFERREKLKLEILESAEESIHFHSDIELVYVLKGTLDVQVEHQLTHMEREDIFLINSNRRHCLQGSKEVMALRLLISYEMISDILQDSNVILLCDSTRTQDENSYGGLRRLLQKLLSYFISIHENTADFQHISLCYQVMDFLTKNFLLQKTEGTGESDSDKYEARIQEINYYIRNNYQQPISIKDLSKRMHLSDGYLSRFFKKNYGMNFAEYVSQIRLQHAVDELLYSDYPITRIVYDNGFSNVTAFNRQFKREYGMTPSEMRRRSGEKAEKPDPGFSKETEQRIANLLWTESDEPDDKLHGVVEAELNAASARKYKPYWNEAVNIGSAAALMRSDVREHILLLSRAFHFHYVRFWSPLSKELLIDINEPGHRYVFSQLDSILDFLLEMDVKPYIDLAGKPERLQGTTRTSLHYGIQDPVESLENWRSVMKAFVNHILQRYGREEISSWRFELWFDMNELTSEPQVEFYMESLRTVLEVVHDACMAPVGGAGLHSPTALNEEKTPFIHNFYQKMVEKGAIPDFLTVYSYSYDTSLTRQEKYSAERNSDPDFLLHSMELLRRILPEELKSLPVWASEWNLTVSERNLINDTCFKGAYILRNYIRMFEKTEGLVYFRGTDLLSEYYDTGHFLFGGTGLLTRDGVMKPAAFAYDFLNRLYPYYIGRGENFFATSNHEDHFAIVCHNMKKLNVNYYYVEEDDLDRDHMNKYFEDLDPLTLDITIQNVPDGTYQAKIYRINSKSGSIMDIWSRTGFEDDLSRDDIKYFRRNSEPSLSMKNVEVSDGRARLKLTLEANEMMFVRLRRRIMIN